ncbi:uncharacterized protein RHO17_004339 [Thomomys bottae]
MPPMRPTRGAYVKMIARPELGPAMTSAITIRELYEKEILAEPEPGGAESRHFREGALAFKDYMRLIADLDDDGAGNHVGAHSNDGSSNTCASPCRRQVPPQPRAPQPPQAPQVPQAPRTPKAMHKAVHTPRTLRRLTPHPRRRRLRKFLSWQLEEMENVFQEIQYPDASTRRHLARVIRVADTRVKIWFQNRRVKHRKIMMRIMNRCDRCIESDD